MVDNYTRDIHLINKGSYNPITKPSVGKVVNGDLSNWIISLEVSNSTDRRTDSCIITLRTDPDGTFIRNGPILVDELAKYKYLIQCQIHQGSTSGKLFRFEISDVTLREDEANGEVLVITGRGLEYILKETMDSEQIFYKTPKSAFRQRLQNYMNSASAGTVSGVDQTITLSFTDSNLEIPDDHVIKQAWTSTGPKPIMDQLNKVIEVLAEPASVGGTLTDYFWDTNPNGTYANTFDVFAKEYGEHDSSGGLVTISPIETGGEQKDKVWRTDNQRFKNLVIVRGARGAGTLPMELCRFRSQFTHARVRPTWSPIIDYDAGDYVKYPAVVIINGVSKLVDKFYKSKQGSNQGYAPASFTSHWEEDVIGTADNINPWLKDRLDQIRSLANPTPDKSLLESSSGANDGFVGFAPDWNFVKGNYDRNYNDEFSHLTLKWVTRISNAPPTGRELFHGQRILVGTSPTGNFDPNNNNEHANKIAQYDRHPDSQSDTFYNSGTPVWRFSNSPSTDDHVTNMETGEVLRWSGSVWMKAWSIQDNGDDGTGSAGGTTPLHLVKDIQTVEGMTRGVNSATEWSFDWRVINDPTTKNSRGAWWYMMFPYPRTSDSSATNSDVGSLYGGESSGSSNTNTIGWLDRTNLKWTRNLRKGWNHGTDSEDLGIITGVSFKIKLGVFYDKLDSGVSTETLVPNGFANTKHTIWFMDIFDRIAYAKFDLRRNGGWQYIKIPLPATKLHYNRIDEIRDIWGYDLFGDFYASEREYSGVQFDWRFIKAVGIQWDTSYAKGEFGQYTGWQGAYAQDVGTSAMEAIGDNAFLSGSALNSIFMLAKFFEPKMYDIGVVKYTIDEFKFEKDLYVSSNETTTAVDASRVASIEDASAQADYETCRRIADGKKERLQFFPQDYTLTCFGDTRVRVGDKVRVKGTKVPSSTTDGGVPYFDIGVKEVKHIIDSSSYRMVISGTRKFVI